MTKVLLIMDSSIGFSRSLLKGLVKYSKENESWILFPLPSYYMELYGKEAIVEWARDWGADAILAQWDPDGANLLKELDIPVVLQNFKKRSEHFSNLTGDYLGTGIMAAEFFVKRRFQNFAYYGYKNSVWSRERAEGFHQAVKKANGNYFYFESENLRQEPWSKSHIELAEWLLSIPKPIALFACDDTFALTVSEICSLNNILIPDDIALLGVDNDELICNLSDPPISSIELDVGKGGYEAGKLLHQLIEENAEPFNIFIGASHIELRQSTEKYNVKNEHIQTVVDYIKNNFTSEMSINSLTNMVPLSRRNLEVKFKDAMGVSIYQFILQNRIEHFSHLLITTDRSLFDLALESGFNDSNNISRVFKKFKGATPMEFRQKSFIST